MYYPIYTFYHNGVLLTQRMGNVANQTIGIEITLEKVSVSINLTDSDGKHNHKKLSYPMPINEYRTAESIKAEFDYFEKTLLEKNPHFYGITKENVLGRK